MTSAANQPARALVVGGSGHLGTAICHELAQGGFRLAFTYHEGEERARALTASAGRAVDEIPPFELDIEDLPQINRVVAAAADALGGLDALIVASGLATGQPWTGHQPSFFEITPSGFDRLMNVNLRGVFFVCQAAALIMRAGSGGRIVIVGSIDGVKPVPSPPDYACSKSALWGLTQSLARELGPAGILVNLVAPGILEGGIANLLSDDLMKDYVRHSSLRRVGRFEEIARVVGFLASSRNTYVTGQAVVLDGGL